MEFFHCFVWDFLTSMAFMCWRITAVIKCIVQDMHAFTRNFTRELTKSYGIVDITNGTMSAQRFSSVSSALDFIEKYWGNIETEKEEMELG